MRIRSIVAAGLLPWLCLTVPAQGAKPPVGTLTPLHGKASCVGRREPANRHCSRARFGNQPATVAISPDGRNAYVASLGGFVSVFSIDNRGALHQLRGRSGCVSKSGKLGCARVPALTNSRAVVVSADGRNVYVAAIRGVVTFVRDRRTGALKQLAGGAGCVNALASGGCRTARGFSAAVGELAVSRDGHTVYAGSRSLVVLARSGGTGELRQLDGKAGCVNGDGSDGCDTARGLSGGCCTGLALSGDSRSVYVSVTQRPPAGSGNTEAAKFAVAGFSRDGTTGALTQLGGASGCATLDGADACGMPGFRAPQPINWAGDVAVSPDGRNVYVIHESLFPGSEAGCPDGYVAALQRDPRSGALGALAGDFASCGLAMTISADARNLYSVSDFSEIVTGFGRNAQTGALKQTSCVAASFRECIRARFAFPGSVTISPDGRHAYVPSPAGVTVFARQR